MCCSVLIFVYSFCTVQTFIYKTFISQIVFDCSDDSWSDAAPAACSERSLTKAPVADMAPERALRSSAMAR